MLEERQSLNPTLQPLELTFPQDLNERDALFIKVLSYNRHIPVRFLSLVYNNLRGVLTSSSQFESISDGTHAGVRLQYDRKTAIFLTIHESSIFVPDCRQFGWGWYGEALVYLIDLERG